MAACCPPGSWPALVAPADYTPTGTEDKIDDLPIYYMGTPGPKAIIVLPEVFGFNGRLKGICDSLAAEGYFVVMADSMRGDTAEGKPDFAAWMGQFPWATVVRPDFERLLKWLEAKGATQVGALGFCWGAWALCKASAEGLPLKCGAGPHPSIKLESFAYGGDELEMAKKVTMPVLLMPAGNDPDNVKPGGEVAAALAATGGDSHPYPEMQHGWASRGDVSDPAVKRDAEDSLRRAIEFFRSKL